MDKQLLDSLGHRDGTRVTLKRVWDAKNQVNQLMNVAEKYTYRTPDLNQEELEKLTAAEPQIVWNWDSNDQRYGIIFGGRRFFLTIELAVGNAVKCDGGPVKDEETEETPIVEEKPLPEEKRDARIAKRARKKKRGDTF